jgi:hypothetical protein
MTSRRFFATSPCACRFSNRKNHWMKFSEVSQTSKAPTRTAKRVGTSKMQPPYTGSSQTTLVLNIQNDRVRRTV